MQFLFRLKTNILSIRIAISIFIGFKWVRRCYFSPFVLLTISATLAAASKTHKVKFNRLFTLRITLERRLTFPVEFYQNLISHFTFFIKPTASNVKGRSPSRMLCGKGKSANILTRHLNGMLSDRKACFPPQHFSVDFLENRVGR